MVTVGLYPWKRPFLSLRVIEWSLAAGLIVILALIFAYKVRVVQGQAELAAVRSTLGALRTALVIDHLEKKVRSENSSAALTQRNPFELLQRHPANYLGEMSSAKAVTAPGGNWVFDPVCVCIGYLPRYTEWLDSPSGDLMAWYELTGAPGPLLLTAKEAYVWQGEAMN